MKEDKEIKKLEYNLEKLFKLKSEKREEARNLTKDMTGYNRPESAIILLGCLMIICISFIPTFTTYFTSFYGKWVWASPIAVTSFCIWQFIKVVRKEKKYDKIYNECLEKINTGDANCVEDVE